MSRVPATERKPDSAWALVSHLDELEDLPLVWETTETRIVAIDSEKGGVGKTAMTTGLAACAGAAQIRDRESRKLRPVRVLVIDLDPRATASHELGAPTNPDDEDEVTPEFSVNDVLYIDDNDPSDPTGLAADAIMPAGEDWPDNVHLLSAERALGNREADPKGWENRLRLSLVGVADQYDLILMDLPPRPGGKLITAALMTATHVLLPATLEKDGYDGVKQALKTITKVRKSNGMPPLPIVGIVRNIIRPRTNEGSLWDQKLQDVFGDMVLTDAAVPARILRQEARTARVPYTAGTGPDARLLHKSYTSVLNHIGKAG